MEQTPVDVSSFISNTQFERTEPKNRFNSESSEFNPILDKVLLDFPDIRDRYINAFNQHTGKDYINDPSPETFFEDVYKPILITSATITEVQKFRKPQESYPQLYNHDSIRLIIKAMNYKPNTEQNTQFELIKKTMEYMQLTDEEFYRCKIYNICALEVMKMEQQPELYKDIIPQMRQNVHRILDSLRPPQIITKE